VADALLGPGGEELPGGLVVVVGHGERV
jgi:hypothetical protein